MLKKADLLKLDSYDYKEPLPLLNEIYTVVSAKKHDSGFKLINVYGVRYENHNIKWAKKISEISDVIHFKSSDSDWLFSVDYQETGVARYFTRGGHLFRIEGYLSDFIVNVEKSHKPDVVGKNFVGDFKVSKEVNELQALLYKELFKDKNSEN